MLVDMHYQKAHRISYHISTTGRYEFKLMLEKRDIIEVSDTMSEYFYAFGRRSDYWL